MQTNASNNTNEVLIIMDFRTWFKEKRKKYGTQRKLAKMSGVSSAYISQIETGERGIPSAKVLKKLAPYLKVSKEEILARAGYLDTQAAHIDQDPMETLPPEAWESLQEFLKYWKKKHEGKN